MAYINKTLLQLLTNEQQHDRLVSSIVLDQFDHVERNILKQLTKYWREHHSETFSIEVFSQKFFLDVPCNADEKKVYRHIFTKMLEPPNSNIAKNIVRDLRTMAYNKAITQAQASYALGEDIDLMETIQGITQDFEMDLRKDVKTTYCTATVQDMIEDAEAGSSLGWKLRCLNNSMPTCGTGNQIIIAMRPGMGKTSFCADNGVYWLQRLKEIGEARPIVYFNNEGDAIKIKASFMRSALGMTLEDIKKIGYPKAEKMFLDIIGGEDMLQIYNSHYLSNTQMERIIDEMRPGVVFFDMLGNIKMQVPTKERPDLILEAKYQWARGACVKYDFLSIAVSQISAKGLTDTGAPLQFIPDSALKDSRTAVQGACDAIITFGSKDAEGFEDSRFINVAKIFKGAPVKGCNPACRTQVVFDPTICRFYDPIVV